MIYGTIICLGDSLTNGARDELWRGYPIELELELWDRYRQNWACVNAGVNGETSIDVYKRAYGVIRSYPEAAEFVLMVGTNDAKCQVCTPPARYAEHVSAILRTAQRWEKVSYLCTIPDLCGFGAPDFMIPELIPQYNDCLKKLAGEWKISLVDMSGMPEKMYADGVHLNNAGYKEMARRIADAIAARRHYVPVQLGSEYSTAKALQKGGKKR